MHNDIYQSNRSNVVSGTLFAPLNHGVSSAAVAYWHNMADWYRVGVKNVANRLKIEEYLGKQWGNEGYWLGFEMWKTIQM